MKKIILTVAAVFALSFANAQDKKEGSGMGLSKGDVYLSGTVSTESVTDEDTKTTLAPEIGYFISDNISLNSNLSTTTKGDVKATSFGFGARYHFNAGNQFSTYLGLGLNMGKSTDLYQGVDSNGDPLVDINGDPIINDLKDTKLTTLRLNYGVVYFVSSHFALTANVAALSYTTSKREDRDAVNTTKLGLNMDSISLGLGYKF